MFLLEHVAFVELMTENSLLYYIFNSTLGNKYAGCKRIYI